MAERGWKRPGALAAALIVLCAACGPDCSPPADAEAPIVLLVTVDTLRADHVQGAGPGSRTPALGRLAEEGVRFTRAWAAANVTVPSHLGLLTSRPAAAHRVLTNHVTAAEPMETIASRFAAAGYRTAAFVSALHLGPRMVMGKILGGLERFDGPGEGRTALAAGETMDRALGWLRDGACRGPAFAWIHLWDPHMPYAPPAPFDRAFYDGDPRDPRHGSFAGAELDWVLHDLGGVRTELGRHPTAMRALKRALGANGRRAEEVVLYPERLRAPAAERTAVLDLSRPLRTALHRRLPFDRSLAGFLTGVRDAEYPKALYAGEVAYVDRELGRLRDALETMGVARRTILVVTGDHGEGLGDHGVWFNHLGLWEEMLRVPLIVWAPGRLPPGERRDVAGGLDVAPTMLALVGLDPPATMEGRNLFARGGEERPLVAEALDGTQIALRRGDWKLVRTLAPFYVNAALHPEAGQVELYHLAEDPGERTDRARREPDLVRDLSAELDAWLGRHGVSPDGTGYGMPAAPVPRDVAERLRALGYAE